MSKGKGSALSIIALIIGVIGIGAGGYAIYQNFTIEGPQGPPGEDGNDSTEIVAIWEDLTGSGSTTFNITFSNLQEIRSSYFSMGENNESIILTRSGWYKMNIRFVLEGLTIGQTYNIASWKNGLWEEIIDATDPASDTEYHVDSFVFVYSDGDDEFGISCLISASCNIGVAPAYNQASLEYLGGN